MCNTKGILFILLLPGIQEDIWFPLCKYDAKYQGQARGYGRITHFLPLPLRGHHFQRATVTQWLDRFQIPGYQMKDMDIVFPLIPNGLL